MHRYHLETWLQGLCVRALMQCLRYSTSCVTLCDQDTPRDWVARNGTKKEFGKFYVWYDDNTISQIVESRTTRPYEAEIGRNNNTLALIYFRAYQALSTILTAFSATTVNPDLSTRRFKRDKITFTSYQILQLKEKKASYKR